MLFLPDDDCLAFGLIYLLFSIVMTILDFFHILELFPPGFSALSCMFSSPASCSGAIYTVVLLLINLAVAPLAFVVWLLRFQFIIGILVALVFLFFFYKLFGGHTSH